MSVSTTAAIAPASQEDGSGRSWLTLAVGLVLLLGSVLLVLSGQLVRLQNDKNHQPLLPAELAAAGSASGELTLRNSGLLPIEISLEPRLQDGRSPAGFPDTVTLSVAGAADQQVFYDGPFKSSTGPLLVLGQGQSAHLRVSVAAAGAPVSLPYSYYWTARAALPWWWWLPATLIIAIILMVGYWRPWRQEVPA